MFYIITLHTYIERRYLNNSKKNFFLNRAKFVLVIYVGNWKLVFSSTKSTLISVSFRYLFIFIKNNSF